MPWAELQYVSTVPSFFSKLMLLRIILLHGTVSLHANFMAFSLFVVPLIFRNTIWVMLTADVWNQENERQLRVLIDRSFNLWFPNSSLHEIRLFWSKSWKSNGRNLKRYLVLTGGWRITVELINNDGVRYIFHSHILKPYSTNITWTSLDVYQKSQRKKGTNKRSSCHSCSLKCIHSVTIRVLDCDSCKTCQVLILRPLVVSLRYAVSKTTLVTKAVELSFPRLPMLWSNFVQKQVMIIWLVHQW